MTGDGRIQTVSEKTEQKCSKKQEGPTWSVTETLRETIRDVFGNKMELLEFSSD